jgi:cytochrome c peroxidase
MRTSQLGAELNDEEVRKIISFLKSLTGEQPEVEYLILPPETEKTPKPEL